MGHPPWLQLRSGAAYEYGSTYCPAMKFEQDIVWPLAHLARFAGHTEHPWSVAAHASVCAQLAYRTTKSPGTALDALHHDDEEALVGDMPSPLKRMLGHAWSKLASAAECATAACSGWKVFSDIKKYDLACLEAERRVLKPIAPTRDWEFEFDEALVEIAVPLIRYSLEDARVLGQGAYARYLFLHRTYMWEYGDVSGSADNDVQRMYAGWDNFHPRGVR